MPAHDTLIRAIETIESPTPEDVRRFQSFRPVPFGQELLGPEFRTPAPFDPFGGLPQATPEGIQNVLAALLTGGTAGALGTMRAAASAPGSTAGAFFGGGKPRPLYHGRGSQSSVNEILEKGFTKSGSSELSLPGASLTTDPTVAADFAKAGMDQSFSDRILAVALGLDPSLIANLDPETYLMGETRGAIAARKPNEFFTEAETFLVRRPENLQNYKKRKVPGSAIRSAESAPGLPRATARELSPKERSRVTFDIMRANQAVSQVAGLAAHNFRRMTPTEAFLKLNQISEHGKAVEGMRAARKNFIDDMSFLIRNDHAGTGPAVVMRDLGLAIGDNELAKKAAKLSRTAMDLEEAKLIVSQMRREASQAGHSMVPETRAARRKALEGLNKEVRTVNRLRNQLMKDWNNLAGHTMKPTKKLPAIRRQRLSREEEVLSMAEEILGTGFEDIELAESLESMKAAQQGVDDVSKVKVVLGGKTFTKEAGKKAFNNLLKEAHADMFMSKAEVEQILKVAKTPAFDNSSGIEALYKAVQELMK